MKHKAAIGVLTVVLLMTLAVCAQARVELYDVKASAYVPAFIDYRLNCPADVTISILPSDAGGTPTGPAIKTATFLGQTRGFHRYIWLADMDIGGTAPVGYYVAELSATSNQAQWDPIAGLYTNDNWTTEQGARPLPGVPDTEGFYGVSVNNNPASAYYGRIYATHKVQKDIFMYRPDGSYLGKFKDESIQGTYGASAPWDVSVADDGYVYVCDRSSMIIHCFDPDGNFVSTSPPTTNHRAIFARTTSDGVTHIIFSGSTYIKKITVQPDHTTWQVYPWGGNNLFDPLSSTDEEFGMWANADVTTIYQACLAGTGNGVSKWNLIGGTWTKETQPTYPFVQRIQSATDVSLVDDATDFLWITRQVARVEDDPTTTQNERVRALYKTNATTNATIASTPYDIITWGLMNSADGVGNVAICFGKSTATWAQRYWGLFAEAGIYTCGTKRTTAFYLPETPSPVIVPGSSVWTPDNTVAADNSDSASVSFKVMDVNGWADITSVVLDLRPLGYGSAVACALTQDLGDPGNQTAIATLTGIVARVGTRCTTSNGQPVHYLTASPLDTTNGGYPDEEEVKLNVTGDDSFDAYINHRRIVGWLLDGAYIVATGGGIPGATDPRAAGPFTYRSTPTIAGYAFLEMSAGSFGVTAQKTGFGSEAPLNINIPYAGFTVDLYLRPLTIAEARATGNDTFVNVEGVCYAQPKGVAPTAAYGLEARTDTMVKRNQWYVCDPNDPAHGMLFMITAPSDAFVMQWDDVDGGDPFGNTTYIGKRPAVGETTMITGLLGTPGGHERRVLIQNAQVEAAMGTSPITIDRIYLNEGNLGGLPGTPVAMSVSDVYHSIAVGFSESWGKYGQVTGAIVLAYQADGVESGVGMTDPVPYYTVGDLAGNTCHVAIDMPASLNITSILPVGATYTFTGAVGRRTRNGQGAIRPRGESDMVQTAAAQAVLKTNLRDQAGNAVTGAQWRRVGELTWLNSGTLELLATGLYTVEFKPVTGYVTPANADVSLTAGTVTTLTGTYTKYGTLKVTLAPPEAVTAGAQWRRVGTVTWLNSAATESLPPGDYTVEFKEVTGFIKPADLPVIITAATTTSKTGTYTAITTPDELSVVRTLNDGDPVNVHGIVTAKIGSALWIEAADRSIGIRVEGTSAAVEVGDDAQVVGAMDINADGEMVIVPSTILEYVNGTEAPAALDLRSREVGGVTCGTTPGVTTGRGALNVGLKVHLLGIVTSAGTSSYYLWDGANRSDAPTSDGVGIGVLIDAAPPTGVVPWQHWVEVTGVVGIAAGTGVAAAPKIIPISAAQVTSFDTITADAGTALTDQWNLMSVIAAPAADSDGDEWSPKAYEPYMVLAPLKTPDEVDGRMYRWENCSGGLYIYDLWSEVGSHGPFGGLLLGDGYWLQLDVDWPVSYSGKNSALDQWIGVCSPGWLIIGQPKDHSTYLTDVKVHDGAKVWTMYEAVIDPNNWIDCVGYWWDNVNQGLVDVGIPDCWASTDTLVPWRGYWIQAYRGDLALIVPETPAAP